MDEEKKETEKVNYFDFSEVLGYFFRKKDPNRPKNFNPFFQRPKTITMLITNRARTPVTMRWLVVVNAYGDIPIRFAARMKKKSVKTNGKNRKPSSPAVPRIISATKP